MDLDKNYQLQQNIKYLWEVHASEEAMQKTINFDALDPDDPDVDCYAIHEKNKQRLEIIIRDLESLLTNP